MEALHPDEALRKAKEVSIETRVREAVNHIEPRVKQKHPELYTRVIDRLRESGFGRNDRWCDWLLVKSFHGWLAVAGENDKPSLDVLLALQAGSKVIGHGLGSRFYQEVTKRNLVQWLDETLDRIESQSTKEKQRRQQYRIVKIENENDWVENAPRQYYPPTTEQSILPSIERDQDSVAPMTKDQFNRATARPTQKRPRQDSAAGKPSIATTDVATQTDNQMLRAWLSTQRAELAKPVRDVVEQVVSCQTESLTKALSVAMRDGMQEALAQERENQSEIARQRQAALQLQMQIQRQHQPPPPTPTTPVWHLQHPPSAVSPMPNMAQQHPFQRLRQIRVASPATDPRQPGQPHVVAGSKREAGKLVDFSAFRYRPKEEDHDK